MFLTIKKMVLTWLAGVQRMTKLGKYISALLVSVKTIQVEQVIRPIFTSFCKLHYAH